MRQRLCCSLTLAGAILILTACHKGTEKEVAIQTVRVARVETIKQDMPERYSATIAPIAQVDLAFKSPGLISRFYQVRGSDGRIRDVQAGDRVAQNTELAAVRTIDYEQRLDQAAAQVRQTEAQLAQARAQLTQAQATFNEAEIAFTRANNLYQLASLVKPQFDQAKARYEASQASVKAAEAAVGGAEAAAATAQAVLSEARLSLSDASLRAPFDGWLTARNVDRGMLVGNATIGFSMMDTHLVKAVFAVPDTSLKMVRLGQKQVVALETLQHALQGVVTSIAPQADARTRVFPVEVTLENPNFEVKPGMIASLVLGPDLPAAPRLAVPLGAIVRAPSDPGAFAVFRVIEREGKTFAEAKTIQVGRTVGNSIEVTGGVAAGERIVSLGAPLLRNGQEVRAIPGE